MSFQPIIPLSGYAGWTYLQRTYEAQQQLFDTSSVNKRSDDYFRANISKVTSAAELVQDRRLLETALAAFGLQGDVQSKAFVRRLMEDGTSDSKALSNRLADKRYLAFAKAFDFSDPKHNPVKAIGFADQILGKAGVKRFEEAVGLQSDTMRLAMNVQRELAELATSEKSEATKWYTILGNKPLRQVFEKTFNLPESFGSSDIDAQLRTMQSKARSIFGSDSVSQFAKPEQMEKLTRLFVIKADMQALGGYNSSAQNALMLLQSIPRRR